MIEVIFGLIISVLWISFEYWRAPMMDEQTGRITKKGRTLKDLFKNRK